MPCIKVRKNEWAIIDRAKFYNFSLWTDQLNGCIAVAIVTDRYAFLTHISDKISLIQWDYEVSINFLNALQHLDPLPRNAICEIVLGSNDETQLSWAVYQTIYTLWKVNEVPIDSEPRVSHSHRGIRILYPSLSNFELLNRMGHRAEWGENKNTITGTKYLKHTGFLTDKNEI